MREFSKEKNLIRAIIKAEKNGEEYIFKKFKGGLVWYLKKKIGNNEDVDDIIQETFKNLFKSIRKGIIPPNANLRDYLFGILKNTLSEFMKKKSKDEMIKNQNDDNDFIDRRTPETEYLRKERTNFIVECIDSLPKKYREILVLHYLQGYSIKEISALTNLSPGTVCYRLHIGRKKIIKKANKKLIFADIL